MANQKISRSEQLFRRLLRLFPFDFRWEHGREMEQDFRARHKEEQRNGGGKMSLLKLWWETITDIARTAPREHFDMLRQDVGYALRTMRKNPGFTIVAVLTLALGIGANTAIFSLVNGLLLRPLPGRNPGELATVYTSDSSGPLYSASSYPDYEDFRDHSDAFSQLAAYKPNPLLLSREGLSDRVMGEFATWNYFETLGVTPLLGRGFASGEDQPGAPPVTILSYSLWQRSFGADPRVIGQSVNLNGTPATVIGVGPEDFSGVLRGVAFDLWIPINTAPQILPGDPNLHSRGNRGLFVIGRLRPGATVDQAQAELTALVPALFEEYPGGWSDRKGDPRTISVLPENLSRIFPAVRGAVIGFMGLLLVVVGLVLLIACSNVAGLLLARASARHRELALRLALGAGRWRLVRQLLTENAVLALTAGAAGVLLATWTSGLLMAFRPPLPISLTLDLGLDYRVLGFALGLSLLTVFLVGLAPALQASRPNLVAALKEGSSGSAGCYRRSFLRSGLVVAQVSLSVLLLVVSGLFLRSLANAGAIDPGFDPENLLVASLDLEIQGYEDAGGLAFYQQLQEKLENHPLIESASTASSVPLDIAGWWRMSVAIEGYTRAPGEDMAHHIKVVGPGYFEIMRTPIVAGRSFTERDSQDAPGVVIVNEAFARRFWPGENPIGKRMTVRNPANGYPLEVIGMAQDGKYVTLGEDPRPHYFLPHRQYYRGAMDLVVRSGSGTGQVADAVRSEIRSLDPKLILYNVRTMEAQMGGALLPVRLAATLLGVFGTLALVLATVGLYGVLSYAVSQREREIGIRMALGARPANVLGLVLRHGMLLALAGTSFGLVAAFGATRFLTALLYGVSPVDPITFIGIPVVLVAVAFLACIVPARRAMKVNPMVALRYE